MRRPLRRVRRAGLGRRLQPERLRQPVQPAHHRSRRRTRRCPAAGAAPAVPPRSRKPGAGQQIGRAGRQRVGQAQRDPEHLGAVRAGDVQQQPRGAQERRRRPRPRSAWPWSARGTRGRGGRARCPAGAARAGTPARRGIPGGRGCRCRDIQQAASRSRRASPRLAGEQRVGPGEQRRRQGRVAAEAARPVPGRRRAAGPGRAISARHALHEPALAQAAGAEHHAARAGGAQHAAQHHRGEGQVVDAPARDAGQPFQRAARRRRRSRRRGRALPRGRSCSGAPCAAGSRSAPCGCAPARARRRRPDTGRGPSPSASQGTVGEVGLGDGAGAHRVAAGALGQPDHAERAAVCDAPRTPASQPHQFQRAAADIGQDAVGGGDAAQHAHRRRARLPASPDRMRIGTSGMRACSVGDEGGAVAWRRAPRRWPAPRTAAAPMARATAW